MTIIAFDIETIPDIEGGRRLYDLHDLSEKDVASVMFHKRRQETGDTDRLRLHLHRIIAISLVVRVEDQFRVCSLGNTETSEEAIIRHFFQQIEESQPKLVSWNGGDFHLPVLHYRAMVHGIQAPRDWSGDGEEGDLKWSRDLGRAPHRHTDLMDVLAGERSEANAPLDEMAGLMGFPAAMGMAGAGVWDAYLDGDIAAIRHKCETDVLKTYLVYLRFQLVRGQIDQPAYQQECSRVRDSLQQQGEAHLDAFLAAWPQPA